MRNASRRDDKLAEVTYKAGVFTVGLALLASLFAATAVQLGFGAAFVSDGVAYATTGYATLLSLLVAGREPDDDALANRLWLRLPVAVGATLLVLVLLRGPLLLQLPMTEFWTTGHSPFVVFPVATSTGLGILWLLRRLPRRSRGR